MSLFFCRRLSIFLSLLFLSQTVLAESGVEFLVNSLPGDYIGKDPLNRPCSVSVFLDANNVFQFSGVSASTNNLIQVTGISKKSLKQKMDDDLEFRRKEDKNFNADILTVNYYLRDSQQDLMEKSIGIFWHSLNMTSMSLTQEQGNGVYIFDRQSIYCFGLEKK